MCHIIFILSTVTHFIISHFISSSLYLRGNTQNQLHRALWIRTRSHITAFLILSSVITPRLGALCKSGAEINRSNRTSVTVKIPRDRGVITSWIFEATDEPSSNLLPAEACFSTTTRKGWIPSTSIPQHVRTHTHTRGSLNHPWPVSTARLWHTLSQSCASARIHASTMDLWRSCRPVLVPRATYLSYELHVQPSIQSKFSADDANVPVSDTACLGVSW